ncbi:hypothetical protein DY000_02003280 [Brassica cretica]|uniref:Maintenance of Photosystem II under High light 2 C-terminal domain-containing protein n=1 Tax=Brassica cretica TaxID=69181 RepID=A0ABQ7C308_BRACR|nr:hypothetical protein DY000_02003280 [Brassica cretica]
MEQTRTVSWVYDQLSCVWSRGELLEKVKQDRKKRIERRAVLNSAVNEKGYLQDLVYKLSKVGQAIENNDLEAACLVLGKGIDTGWVKTVNLAFTKLFFFLLFFLTHNGQMD